MNFLFFLPLFVALILEEIKCIQKFASAENPQRLIEKKETLF
jgi:hypothetical protein